MEKGYQEAVERDGGSCRGCGKAYTQVHHIKFRSQGGGHEAENLICLCDSCHAKAHGLSGTSLSADLLRAVLRGNGTAKGFRLKNCCYSCVSGQIDPVGRYVCLLWDQETTADHWCASFVRDWATRSPLE